MRDKPNDDSLRFNKPDNDDELRETPFPQNDPFEEEETDSKEKESDEPTPEEPSEEPPVDEPDEPPAFDQETAFRVRDQFDDINAIPPTLSRDTHRPSKAQVPGAGLAETARPGRSIRHENTFQDFFRNLDIIKIVRGVYRRFWVVLLAAFGLMLLFMPIARKLQGGVSYSAQSVIIYTKPTQKQVDAQGSSFILRPLSQDTLVDMFLSPSNIRQLEEATGLKPLEKSVSFDSQSKSDIVTLHVNNMPDETTAIKTVNKLADIIIENNDQYYRQLATDAYNQFKKQRESAEKTYQEAVSAVEAFQLKNQILELNTQYDNYFSSVNAATERLSIAKVAHEGLLVRIENYKKIIAELPDEILNESLEDNPIKRRISNAEAALLQARIQYAADNPKILRQERELEELRKMLQNGNFNETRERTYVKNPLKGEMEGELVKLQAEEKVADQQVTALQTDLVKLKARFDELPRLEKEYASLLEKRAQADAILKSTRAAEKSAQLTLDSNLSDFKLLSQATTAEATGASLIGKIIPIAGFILGFFGGLAALLLIELLDAKIRTQLQLEKAYDAPCLASIIEIPHLEDYDTYNLLLPSLREISERLNVVLQGQRAKVLGFFSSLDEEGKSMLSFNLARYYHSLNIKVLYVSFDSRSNPCLPDAGDIGWPQRGIEDYLRGNAELSDMLSQVNEIDTIRVQEPGTDIMDLAKGSAMPRLWDLLRQHYELIITEAPSVLDHPLSGTIAGFMDEIIYVLASSVSDRRLVDAGLEFLEDRGLIPRALIFNRVNAYYLEDVRQQRILRNLSEKRSTADIAVPQEEEPPEDFFSDDDFTPPSGDDLFAPMDSVDDDEDDIPELIGEEERPAVEKDEPSPVDEDENDDLSFRKWMDQQSGEQEDEK